MLNRDQGITPGVGGVPCLAAVDLGGTKLLTALATREGRVLLRKKEETRAREGPGAIVGQVDASLRELVRLQGLEIGHLAGIGVCAAGFYNHREGLIMESPNLQGFNGVSLGKMLEERTGLFAVVENDANAAAYGEYRQGAGQGKDHLVFVTVSTGIGGGIILGGELFRGAEGYAGEIGHFTIDIDGPRCQCGNRGCLEVMASGTAIARQALEVLALGQPTRMLKISQEEGREEVTARHVFTAAALGDEAALEIVGRTMEYLGAGLAGLASILNPEIFVIGGGVSLNGESFFQPLREVFYRRAPGPVSQKVQLVPALLGEEAGIVGAALLLAEKLAHREGKEK